MIMLSTPRWFTFVMVLSLTSLLVSSAYACCSNYAEFAAQCRAQGGIPGMGATCKPQSGGGSSGGLSGLSGGGASSNQQLMMGIAGALGAAFGESLREQAANRAQQRQQDMERAAVEMARFQALEQERMRQLEARHQKLLSSLKGGLGHTELGLKRMGSGTLELKGGTAMFGESNATGTVKYGEETSGLALKMPEAPPTPTGKFIDPSQMDKVWADYHHAADEHAKADLRRQQLEEEKKLAERIKKEAEKKYQEEQQQAALIPKDQPAKQEADDKLAQAEKLLNQATDLDRKATQDLDKAKQDLQQAKLDLDRTEKERAKAEKSLAQAETGQTK
ncbi:MAG: hypothetical protein E8D45_01805 [Nitrospira sp.]|nr:MAG: hypothetical protein E8D45_01805 [Nitrospira sp.]